MSTPEGPTAEQVTLNTIRQWAERTIETTAEAGPRTSSGGFRQAARQVMAILDAHGRPVHEPVHMPSWDEP